MEQNTKKIFGTLAIAAAIGGGFYLFEKGRKIFAGAKMNFALLGFRIHKLNLQEVTFAVKLRCYNPTRQPVTLAIHQVTVKYKDSDIAFSTPDLKGIVIEAGKSLEHEITFQVPYMNLLGSGLSMELLKDTSRFTADLSFKITFAINGETITTTQKLTDDQMSGTLNGLGIVSGPRNTQNGKAFNHLIKKADSRNIYIKDGAVNETVQSVINIIGSHHREVEELAKKLYAGTVKETCRNIFHFAYNYLQYQQDKKGTEQLRTPARSWQDGQIRFKQEGDLSAGIDCDDFTIFCGSVLKCLGIPFKIRITKYNGRENFQHIYIYVPAPGDSEDEIIIDPVLSKFDYQKPYSYEKSNFDLSALESDSVEKGIAGFEGNSGLGLPIYALSGIDENTPHEKDHDQLIAIVSGIDFEPAFQGLGSSENATLNYLKRTYNYLLRSKENRDRIAHIQNPDQFIEMLGQAIKYWDSPKRDAVLDKLIAIEDKLVEAGLINLEETDPVEGFDEFEGLAGKKRKKSRFFRAIKAAGKKIGGAAKKVVKFAVRFNPLSVAIRNGLLAAFRLNTFGLSKKLQYAYLPESMASKYNIDPLKLKDLKARHAKVLKLFKGLQGKEENLKKAILKGAKQKNSDFSLSGDNNLGVVATAASVGAASGVLVTIKKWLDPVKNIYNKVRGKAAINKVERLKEKGKEVDSKTKLRAEKYIQQVKEAQENQKNTSVAPPSYSNKSNAIPSFDYDANKNDNPKKGLSKGAKIGIAVGIVGVLGVGAYYLINGENGKSRNSNSGSQKTRPPQKKTLGTIKLS